MPALRLSVDGKHFENGPYLKTTVSQCDFSRVFPQNDMLLLRFQVWKENILCVFRVKPPLSNSFGVLCTLLEIFDARVQVCFFLSDVTFPSAGTC